VTVGFEIYFASSSFVLMMSVFDDENSVVKLLLAQGCVRVWAGDSLCVRFLVRGVDFPPRIGNKL